MNENHWRGEDIRRKLGGARTTNRIEVREGVAHSFATRECNIANQGYLWAVSVVEVPESMFRVISQKTHAPQHPMKRDGSMGNTSSDMVREHRSRCPAQIWDMYGTAELDRSHDNHELSPILPLQPLALRRFIIYPI